MGLDFFLGCLLGAAVASAIASGWLVTVLLRVGPADIGSAGDGARGDARSQPDHPAHPAANLLPLDTTTGTFAGMEAAYRQFQAARGQAVGPAAGSDWIAAAAELHGGDAEGEGETG